MEPKSHLLEFYGGECSHCLAMAPLMDRLQAEEGVAIDKYEVWHSDENAKLMRKYDQSYCGRVPFFYNPQ